MHHFSWMRCDGVLSMNIAISLDDIGLLYSSFIIVIICGMCFLSVFNADLLDLFQFMYILWMNIGSLMFVCYRGISCLDIGIDRKIGSHEVLIADCTRIQMWIPFCDVEREMSYRTCCGTSSVEANYFVICSVISCIVSVCSDLKIKILLLLIPSENTSAHRV